jgi:hypothetical protein
MTKEQNIKLAEIADFLGEQREKLQALVAKPKVGELRDALIAAMKEPLRKYDAMGVLYFLKGWLSVQPDKDREFIRAICEFTEGRITEADAIILEERN